MNIHEVLLQLVWLGEQFETALTAVLCGRGHEMRADVLLERLMFVCPGELGPAVRAGQGSRGGGTLGTGDSGVLTRQHPHDVTAAPQQAAQTPRLLQV